MTQERRHGSRTSSDQLAFANILIDSPLVGNTRNLLDVSAVFRWANTESANLALKSYSML